MKAVVLGGNGFIGSHVVDALLDRKWHVVVYDRAPERYRRPLADVEYILGELGNKDSLAPVLSGADLVFHLISTTVPQSSNESPIFDLQSNLLDTVRFLDVCVECRVGKVIFLSSGGTVYGLPQLLPIAEKHPTNPICSHGIVKLAIEKYFQLYKHLYGLSYVILRPSNPYGPRQDPSGTQGVVAVFLGRIAKGLPVTIWGDGETVRDYFHVSELAEACLAAATMESADPIFNIGSGQGKSLNQLLQTIEMVIDKPTSVVKLPLRPFDAPRIILDVHKAHAELNWQPRISLEQGILNTWDWIRSLP